MNIERLTQTAQGEVSAPPFDEGVLQFGRLVKYATVFSGYLVLP